jgi:23S rRNA (pseudouridine1915-N3)-methyltransferase
MRLHICAVGRMKSSPEKTLFDDYCQRMEQSGRALGLSGPLASEVEEKRGLTGASLMEREAQLLEAQFPRGAKLVMLDERGRLEPSDAFAKRLGSWRDQGTSDLAFVIGGANGLHETLRGRADHLLAFGPMTWPHMLVRVMLAEQIYRAMTIMSGHPYHRA